MALRLLIFDRSIFLPCVPLQPLLALLQHKDLSIRLLAIELFTYATGIADGAKQQWIAHYVHKDPNVPIIALWENKTIDFGVVLVFEAQKVREARKAISSRDYFREDAVGAGRRRILLPEDLGAYTGDVCGILIPRFGDPFGGSSDLVLTENTRANLRNIARTIVDEKPLLLQSVPGAGKSFLVDETAKLFGRYDGIPSPSKRIYTEKRYCTDHVDRSNGCKASSRDVCHGHTWIVYLASRDPNNSCEKWELDCH
jgi:midasin (ATPase involved in ribosome maturation)